jgi:murein DD-endopeptidase MepM/ murein hydrolase activator NlpD
MTRKQAAFVIVLNAIVSLIISVSVVLIAGRVWMREPPASPAQELERAAPTIYVVQEGDSLLAISLRFDVPIEDIMRANNITDPDVLFVGQELVIPISGLPTPTATETPPPTVTFTPSAGELKVIIGEVFSPGDYDDEMVVILNLGQPVLLEGWTLSDRQGNVYTFPAIFLEMGGGVRVHTRHGRNSAANLYWGLDEAVWGEEDEVATLRDGEGNVVDVCSLPR